MHFFPCSWASRQSFMSWCFPSHLPRALSLQEVFASGFHTLSPREVLGLSPCAHDSVQVCTLFPRKVEPGIASQLLIGNQFPSLFQRSSPGSNSGFQNWRQKPTDRKQKSFCLTKRMLLRQAGMKSRREGPFQDSTMEREEPLVLKEQPFVPFLYHFCRFFE